ncbi:MAG TPA: acyl-CoA desaturase [Flavobacteriia bacterium]|nr:acyl-CoA desaturase [Flavobacteriia bacterium]
MRTTIDKTIGTIQFSIPKTAWLYFILLPIFWIDFSTLDSKLLLIASILICFTVGLGHSIGLHRGVIHKTFTTSKTVRNIFLYLFVLTGLGSPLHWIKLHYYRDYWQNRLDCPPYFAYKHSLIRDFWWNLHLQFTANDIKRYNIPKEDLNDKWIIWLHKTWYLHNLLFMVFVYLLSDMNTVLIIVFLRMAITILGHWFVGFMTHKYGYARFNIENANESAYNDIILGLFSFGEGFHNNHHAHPNSAKFSLKWYEIDIGWYLIVLLKKLHLIYNVKEVGIANTKKQQAKKNNRIIWSFPWKFKTI